MFDMKGLSAAIRAKKKGTHRADMDYAGQESVDPNDAWDAKMATEINEDLDDPDHEPASKEEMGEHESSQDIAQLKKSVARIHKYFESL
jgi:hypothetical protein